MVIGWQTYDGRQILKDNISHQHLSNIYYYTHFTMAEYYPDAIRKLVIEWLHERFNGVILPYKPVPEFEFERVRLTQLNAIQPNGDIVMQGRKLGTYQFNTI